jgi:hypothetical protein
MSVLYRLKSIKEIKLRRYLLRLGSCYGNIVMNGRRYDIVNQTKDLNNDLPYGYCKAPSSP